MHKRIIVSHSFRTLLLYLNQLGVSPKRLIEDAQITDQELNEQYINLTDEQFVKFWKSAVSQSGDPLIAMKMAEALPFGMLQILEHLLVTARNLKDTFKYLARYGCLIHQNLQFRINEDEQKGLVVQFDRKSSADFCRHDVEYFVSLLVCRVRNVTAPRVLPRKINFRHAPVAPIIDYEKFFQCPVGFNAPTTEVIYSMDKLHQELKFSDSYLFQLFLQNAESEKERLALSARYERESFVKKIEEILVSNFDGGNLNLESISGKIGMSPRSTQRRLQSENITFKGVLERFRLKKAKFMLSETPSTVEQIAETLGYSDRGAFDKAFKKWTGQSPVSYRRSQL